MPDIQTPEQVLTPPVITLPKTVKEEYGDAIENLKVDEGFNYIELRDKEQRPKVMMYVLRTYKESNKEFTSRTIGGKIYLFRVK